MKKLVSIIILCLACLGSLEAQNYWKPIGMQGIFLGVGPDGSYYSYYGSAYGPSIIRSQDEGDTWQIVLGYETGFDCYFNNCCFSVSPEGRVFLFEDYPYRAFFSDDNGDTWQTTAPAPLIYDGSAEHLYALNNDTIVGVTDNHYAFWTTDGGASWDTTFFDWMTADNAPVIEDLLVNENGEVFFAISTLDGEDGGIYCSMVSDMENWQVAAAHDCSITDMAFDPEGNVVACGWTSEGSIGFQHTPGFYVFNGRNVAVSENGIVYTSNVTEDNKAVLAYSLDHGETFTEIGEGLLLDPPIPGGEDGSLYYGYDNYLYFEGHGFYWKGIRDANYIIPSFAPLGAEWYFNVSTFMNSPITYYRMAVEGDTLIQGHTCSVITQPFFGGNGNEQFVYEENRKVYWYNQTLQGFTTLYDFAAEVGDTWICDIDSCSFEIQVQSVDEVTWEGHTYRVQHVYAIGGDEYYNSFFYAGEGTIIEGIGEISGLFPYPGACIGEIYDGNYTDYLRCYLVDGDLLYHYGSYECDQQSYCWDGTVAEAYAGGDGTAENPYRIATSEQLALLAQQTNNGIGEMAYYELVANINLQRCDGGTWPWTSIGTATNMFMGHFNGNGHYILNVNQYISDGDLQPVGGLFGYTDHAEISNVRLVQCSIRGNGQYVGGLVGYAGLSNISNCSIGQSSVMTEAGVAGGLVGCADMPFGTNGYSTEEEISYITNCLTDVATWIEGSDCAGGIVGKVNKNDGRNPWVITDCRVWNNGYTAGFSVTSDGDAGGIVGWFRNGSISGCLNQFVVTGGNPGAGGIAGTADLVTIENCTNQGEISGGFATGGIVGYGYGNMNLTSLDIIDCFNEGSVTCHDLGQNAFVGGIVGLWGSKIIRCVNRGDVMGIAKSSGFVGGIVGDCDGIVANCYNRGNVTAAMDESVVNPDLLFVGGISATPDPTIYNVYNTGVVTGPELPASVIHDYGNIIGRGLEDSRYLNAYWLENDMPACGNVSQPELHGSTAFVQGATSTSWTLNDAQYGTTDLLEALNRGAEVVLDSVLNYPYLCTWLEDMEGTNDGYPVLGPLPGDSIYSGDLLYSIINVYSHKVSVIGHVDGENAQGEIVIPETVEYEGDTYVVTEVGERAFEFCRRLVSIDVANTVTRIGSRAFYDCDDLQSIHLPDSLETVSSDMLFGCSSLTEITLPSTVTEIGEEAFSSCRALTEIVLPESVSVIRNWAFSSCGVQSVIFPESMVSIGNAAFYNCGNLTTVTLPQGITTISESLFSGCGRLESVVVPETVTSIDKNAFRNCESLNEIVIPNSVESIGRSAFEGCRSLSLVELGSSVSYLAEAVFLIHSLDVRLNFICHNPVPAQCEHNTFPQDAEQQGVIMVPCGTGEVYLEAWGEYWQNGSIEEDCGSGLIEFHGSEWYYEIVDEYGNVTYQHLEYVADTTVNHKDVQIIIRTNTLYDKGEHQEVTREYLYLEDEVVYWWNSELMEFTVLYDLGAQPGDSWDIKVGTETLTMHVDAVNQYYYEGQMYRMLQVSDEGDLFSGTIVCGVGHLSSFFPERLMTRGKGFRVHGLRCYWNYGNLLFTVDRDNCDAIYVNLHNGIDEPTEMPFAIYPNPTNNVLVVETVCTPSLPTQTYRITNLMGQTLQSGTITAETQQVDVSGLPEGMYFITIGEGTRKFVVNK